MNAIGLANPAGRRKKKKDWRLLAILLPFVVFTFVFSYIPLFGWYFAFINYKPAIPVFQNKFVGLYYFKYLFKDWYQVGAAMKNTVIFAGLGYCFCWFSMLLAILLNEVKSNKFRRVVQTTTTFPNFISWIIVYSLAYQMFSFDGLVSTVTQQLGLTSSPVSILADDDAAYIFQQALSMWKGAGWGSVVYMSAIAGIDQELYEAAAVDGANRFHRIVHITLPQLLPTFIVLQLLGISSFVGVGFEQYYLFRNSMNSHKLTVIDVYTYIIGLTKAQYSYATAIGILKSVISLTMLFGVNKLAAKIRGNSIV